MTERLRNLANVLMEHYKNTQAANWNWFESFLAYDNGILPLALLHSAEILNDKKLQKRLSNR